MVVLIETLRASDVVEKTVVGQGLEQDPLQMEMSEMRHIDREQHLALATAASVDGISNLAGDPTCWLGVEPGLYKDCCLLHKELDGCFDRDFTRERCCGTSVDGQGLEQDALQMELRWDETYWLGTASGFGHCRQCRWHLKSRWWPDVLAWSRTWVVQRLLLSTKRVGWLFWSGVYTRAMLWNICRRTRSWAGSTSEETEWDETYCPGTACMWHCFGQRACEKYNPAGFLTIAGAIRR